MRVRTVILQSVHHPRWRAALRAVLEAIITLLP
jgi:hypothetical protein